MMEDHFIRIYQNHAATYHEMIACEDVDGHLRPALEAVTSFAGKSVLDLGTGTGRIPLLFPDAAVTGLDLQRAMLLENQRQQMPEPGPLVEGDMRALPFHADCFQIVTAGWALGHFTGWYPRDWQTQILLVIEEAQRVLVPGGHLIILETLTTGSHTPAPPSKALADYYDWLESDLGFSRREVQTDYLFDSLELAFAYAKFFFGDALAKKVRRQNWVRLPEWTGIWSRHYA